jgi:hypothetical protein
MRWNIGPAAIELHQGDITDERVDAIVNAANQHLAGGGGDGAIHRRGGPAIMEETDRLYRRGCPTGSAVISGAGNLAAKDVIHAVGPVWQGGAAEEAREQRPPLFAPIGRQTYVSLHTRLRRGCGRPIWPPVRAGVGCTAFRRADWRSLGRLLSAAGVALPCFQKADLSGGAPQPVALVRSGRLRSRMRCSARRSFLPLSQRRDVDALLPATRSRSGPATACLLPWLIVCFCRER